MRIVYTLILVLACSTAFAQGGRRGPQMDREKIQAARIAFLTNRLELDSEKAQVFWPIFNEYEKAKGELAKKYNAEKRTLYADGTREVSEENAEKMLDIYMDQKQVQLDLEKKYLVRFKEVLTPKQVWMVIRFDSDFRRSIMQRISKGEDFGRQPGKSGRERTGGN